MKYFFKSLLTATIIVIAVPIVFFTWSFYQYSYGQGIVDNSATIESVTSVNDALLKSILIISQVVALGTTFNHFIFKRYSNKKASQIINDNNNLISYFNSSQVIKRYTIIMLLSFISIVIFSTGIILLQSIELGNNLELDLSTAFYIIYLTPVGTVWLLRIITSILALALTIIFYMVFIRLRTTIEKSQEKPNNLASNSLVSNKRSHRWFEQILLIILLSVTSINLFSNSMVSHSNSLPSFSSLAVSVDWLHFMAVAIWIGGLFYLSLVAIKMFNLPDKKNEDKNKGRKDLMDFYEPSSKTRIILSDNISMAKFSFITIISLCIIGVTGLYLSFVHIQNFGSLLNSLYGQLLILKLALAFPLILIGRYNKIKLHKYIKLVSTTTTTTTIVSDKKQGRALNDKTAVDIKKGINLKDNETLRHKQGQMGIFYKSIKKSLILEVFIGISVLIVASFLSVISPPSLETTSDTSFPEFNDGNNENIFLIEDAYPFMYMTIALSIIIIMFAFINYRKTQRQVTNLVSMTK